MPRPGPRPYECVRRAWHSERHQPIRGSIIQQIFRVVSESHTPATKKNKEWQEKLPVVVLKAEEILYSKANSEAEYVNVETLWDRLNDAISTIIRRDESTETGELLPPCVEATLNLGCTPVKASRSQRHNNPRTYLSPRVQESPSIPSTNVDSSTNEQSPQLHQLQSPDQSKFERPTIANSGLLISESNRHIPQNNNPTTTCNFPFRLQNSLPRGMQSTTMESNTSLSFGSVYPLYYGTQYQLEGSQHLHAQIPQMSNSNNVLLGVPIGPSIQQPIERGFLQRFPSINVNENAQADLRETHEKASSIECDLSLRLGLFPDTCMSTRKHSVRETKDADSSSSQDESNLSETLAQRTEFSFFPKGIADGPFASCSR